MKIYLAAKMGRRFELRYVRNALQANGHKVTSHWIDVEDEKNENGEAAARMDLDDVDDADMLIFIGQPQGSENRGGGRWFEFGYAYARGKKCRVVLDGGHESVFSYLVQTYPSIEAAIQDL